MPSRGRSSLSLYFAYFGLAIIFLASLGVRLRSAADTVNSLIHASEKVRPPFDLNDPGFTVISVTPAAAAAGMAQGDALKQVNGQPYLGMSDLDAVLFRSRPGDRLNVQLARHDSTGTRLIDAQITLTPNLAPTTRDWI